MDKLILFLLIIVLILCFKNINVMVKKSDEDVIKVMIIFIIIGLIFMCKDDLVEGILSDNQMKKECRGVERCGTETKDEKGNTIQYYCLNKNDNICSADKKGECENSNDPMVWCKKENSMREFIFSLDKNGDNTFDEVDFREIDSDGDGNITDTELDFKFLTLPITLKSIRSSYDKYTSGITGLDPACGGIMCSKELNQPGECLDLNANPPVCSANSGDCPPGQINCSGNDSGGDNKTDDPGNDSDQGLDFLSGEKRSGDFAKGICYQTYYPKNKGDPCQGDITGDDNWKNQTDFDLNTLNTAGVTTLKLYDWDLNKGCGSHKLFLDDLKDKEMQVIVPISQYFMGKEEGNSLYASDADWGGQHDNNIYIKKVSSAIDNLLNELIVNGSYHPSVYAIGFGNEPDLKSDGDWYENFTNIIKIYLNKEKERITNNTTLPYIVVPLSYGGNQGSAFTGGAKSLQTKIKSVTNNDFINNRFVIGINIFSSANAIEFSKNYDGNFMITEFYSGCNMNKGVCNEIGGGDANAQQFKSALSYIRSKNIPNLKGIFAFLYQPQTMQAGSEKNFGLTKYTDSKYESVENCVSNNNCPPQNLKICDRGKRFNGLAEFYRGKSILTNCK